MSSLLQDIIHQMHKVQFEDEESTVVDVREAEIKQGILDCTNSCYGKFLAEKEINLKSLRHAILKAWKCKEVKVFRVLPNLYQFFFTKPEELQVVTQRGPWNIDNNLLVIRSWYPGIRVEDEDFDHTFFWLNIMGLPREFCTKEVALKVAQNFQDVSNIQLREKGESGERFFRIRASINTKKPIRRIVRLRRENGAEVLAIIRYERLPVFCYACGCMGHITKACTKKGDNKNSGYGYWLITDYIQSRCIGNSNSAGTDSTSIPSVEEDEAQRRESNHESAVDRDLGWAREDTRSAAVREPLIEPENAQRILQKGGKRGSESDEAKSDETGHQTNLGESSSAHLLRPESFSDVGPSNMGGTEPNFVSKNTEQHDNGNLAEPTSKAHQATYAHSVSNNDHHSVVPVPIEMTSRNLMIQNEEDSLEIIQEGIPEDSIMDNARGEKRPRIALERAIHKLEKGKKVKKSAIANNSFEPAAVSALQHRREQ